MIDICESSGFLQALLIIKTIFKIVCLIVPLILIFTVSFDAYKLVINPDDTKKVRPVITKRLAAALIILFVPTIVRLGLSVVNSGSDYERCLNNANSDYIESVKNKEKEIRKSNHTTTTSTASDA